MKLVNYVADKQGKRTGVYEDGVVIDLNRAYEKYQAFKGSQMAKKNC
ncbi:hypothetical protein [Thalassobacillus sp. CUG 92003]|nr:hypothetical protein [Thalassobacillus sp. CUG 92003]